MSDTLNLDVQIVYNIFLCGTMFHLVFLCFFSLAFFVFFVAFAVEQLGMY